MICAVHALIGAALGRLLGRRDAAFAVGVVSHGVCDVLPHRDFAPVVEAPLLAVTLAGLAETQGVDSPEFVGACGAVAPDLENAAVRIGLLDDAQMRFPTHRGPQWHGRPTSSALPQAALAAVCLVVLLWPRSRPS